MAPETTTLSPHPLLNAIPDNLISRFDPVYVEYYNKHNVGRVHTHQIPIEEYRAHPARYAISYPRAEGPEVFRVTQEKCPVDGNEINIRIFEPSPADAAAPRRPAYVNYHGGGFTFGNLEMDDPFCRRICREVGCVVFDVEYRLAPEYRYPIPLNDSWAALNWICDEKADEFHLDINRIAIGGVSAGGQLSAALAIMARDAGFPLAFQLLVVPAVDLTSVLPNGELSPSCPYESYSEFTHTPALPFARAAYACDSYLGTDRAQDWEQDWKISPLKAPSHKGLAPALIITAEMDVLRDEAEVYAQTLERAGVAVEYICYPAVPHPFMMYDAILDAGKKYQVDTVRALKEALFK